MSGGKGGGIRQQDKQEVGVGTATSTRRLVLTRLRQDKGVLRGAESVGSVWAWPPDRNSTTWSCSWRAGGSTAAAPTSAAAATAKGPTGTIPSLSAAASHPLVAHSALRRQGRGREVESWATGADLSALRRMGAGGGMEQKPSRS